MMINEESKPTSKTDESLSSTEECIYLRQKLNVLKAVTNKYQEELSLYRIKAHGADSVIQLFKECRQDNANLQNRIKTLEAVISNCQRKLPNNGLLRSRTEETELLVPGASKKILDNLAKENLRLRRSEKTYVTEVVEMKAEIEKLLSEKNILQENIQIYEQTRTGLSKEKEEETILQDQDQECPENESNRGKQGNKIENVETVSVGCQATDPRSDKLSEFKELMKSTVAHCSEMLHQSSKVVQALEEEGTMECNLKKPVLVDERYQNLEIKYTEATQMNQRWLNHCHNLEGNTQILSANNEELKKSKAGLHAQLMMRQQEIDRLTLMLRHKDTEISQMSKEVNHCRSQDEIYKQQIQVCTEDFNTERKDRQQAVNKAKALQDELTNCKAELERLKLLNNAELISRFQQNAPGAHRYEFKERGSSPPMEQQMHIGQAPPLRHVGMQASPETTSLAPRIPISEYNNMRYRSNIFPENHLPHQQKYVASHSQPREHFSDPKFVYANVPEGENDKSMSVVSMPKFGYVNVPDGEKNQGTNATSMPTLSRTGGLSREPAYSVCPKCNKAFPDSSQPELMAHIDMCNA